MKKLFIVMTIVGLLALSLAITAQAQLPGIPIRASIPFGFIVRGVSLPAGDYEVARLNDDPAGLVMRNVDDKHEHVVFTTESMDGPGIARYNALVFNRYGDEYFLSAVVTAGEQTGRELTPSHAERTLRREMAKNELRPDTVTVALN